MLQNGIVALAAVTFGSMALLLLTSLLSRGKRPASRRLREADGAATAVARSGDRATTGGAGDRATTGGAGDRATTGATGGATTGVGATWERLKEKAAAWLPSLGDPLAPKDQKDRGLWQDRLMRAGVHDPRALAVLPGVKAFLILLGPVAFVLGLAGGLSAGPSLLAGAMVVGLGLVLPGLWLDWRTARRQTLLRRGLPDALDMLVMCVEGGLSLSASLPRVRAELRTAHPELAAELGVAEREMMVGLSAGEALRNAGMRVGLEDLTSLASVLLQSQRYGASVAKAMRTYADGLRNERRLSVEEKAQKAAVKILFPTLLCIFPAIFVVVLGPAAYQIHVIFSHMK